VVVEDGWGMKKWCFGKNACTFWKLHELGRKLLQMTDRKLHRAFRLAFDLGVTFTGLLSSIITIRLYKHSEQQISVLSIITKV